MKSKTCFFTWLLAVVWLLPLSAQNFDIYVCDGGNFNLPPWQILKFDQNGENGEVFISTNLSWPQDIVFLEDQNTVLISNLNTGNIAKFNAGTGAYTGDFATGIGGPTRMEIGPDTLLYVLQWAGNGRVKRYRLDGTFVDDFTTFAVSNSIGLAWDTAGNLYVSSYNGNFVRKFGPTGQDLGNFISTNLNGPTNIWFGANGNLYVNNWNIGVVRCFDSSGNLIGNFITGIGQCEGIDFFPNGNLAIGAGVAKTVRVYQPDGTFVKDLFPPGTLNLLLPNAVVFRNKSASSVGEIHREINFATPSIGTVFRLENPGAVKKAVVCEVFDSSGIFVRKIPFTDSATWDASGLPSGIYHLVAKMADGSFARQKVVVQR